MRALNDREKRTVRFGGIALGIYLVLYCALQIWGVLAQKKSEYVRLLSDAQALRQKMEIYQSRAKHVEKLMASFRLDPARLTRVSVIAQASAAIQSAALAGGVQVGAIRESPARPSTKELGSILLEAAGPAPALLKFVEQTHSLGYPLIIDSMQIGSEPARPGQVKISLTIVILDFDQWKSEKSHV